MWVPKVEGCRSIKSHNRTETHPAVRRITCVLFVLYLTVQQQPARYSWRRWIAQNSDGPSFPSYHPADQARRERQKEGKKKVTENHIISRVKIELVNYRGKKNIKKKNCTLTCSWKRPNDEEMSRIAKASGRSSTTTCHTTCPVPSSLLPSPPPSKVTTCSSVPDHDQSRPPSSMDSCGSPQIF